MEMLLIPSQWEMFKMKFRFYPKESKLYDFLRFPRLLFYKEEYEKDEYKESLTGQNYREVSMSNYLDFAQRAEDRLKPFALEIEKFYFKPLLLNSNNFIDLITRTETIFGYSNEKEFLYSLLDLKDHEINNSIVTSLILICEENEPYIEEIKDKAKEISSNKEKIISFIKDLPIDSALKWNLFMMIEDPLDYTKKYVELMLEIIPIFNEFYNSIEREVCDYGNHLEDYLNKNGSNAVSELTDHILDPKIIEQEEVSILISVVFSYAISISLRGKDNYIGWGLKVEDAIRQLKEINENKINERVQIFKNLGDKTRYEVLKLISSGETSTKSIAEALGVSSATISYHINNFLTSKVVKMDKIDNKYVYVVDYELLNRIIEEFKEDLKFPE